MTPDTRVPCRSCQLFLGTVGFADFWLLTWTPLTVRVERGCFRCFYFTGLVPGKPVSLRSLARSLKPSNNGARSYPWFRRNVITRHSWSRRPFFRDLSLSQSFISNFASYQWPSFAQSFDLYTNARERLSVKYPFQKNSTGAGISIPSASAWDKFGRSDSTTITWKWNCRFSGAKWRFAGPPEFFGSIFDRVCHAQFYREMRLLDRLPREACRVGSHRVPRNFFSGNREIGSSLVVIDRTELFSF